jgi:hypothetical protein
MCKNKCQILILLPSGQDLIHVREEVCKIEILLCEMKNPRSRRSKLPMQVWESGYLAPRSRLLTRYAHLIQVSHAGSFWLVQANVSSSHGNPTQHDYICLRLSAQHRTITSDYVGFTCAFLLPVVGLSVSPSQLSVRLSFRLFVRPFVQWSVSPSPP